MEEDFSDEADDGKGLSTEQVRYCNSFTVLTAIDMQLIQSCDGAGYTADAHAL